MQKGKTENTIGQKMKLNKKQIITIICVILLICAVAVILPSWNEIWYSFGKNLYHLFH